MLDKLPHEVILTISDLLTLEDKLTLIRTCRLLFKLISNTTLFSNLDLFSDRRRKTYIKMVNKFLKRFKKNGYSGSQVKVFSIHIDKINKELFLQLPALFPNITRITVINRITIIDRIISLYFPDQPDHSLSIPWINTLETFSLACDLPALLPLLKTTTFLRLTKLELGHLYYLPGRGEGFDIPYFLPHIKNAPSLKILTLRNCAINLEFLEEIHTSCPHLESLILNQTSILIRNQMLNQPVAPANSLLSLKILETHCFDTNGLFLDYITRKYQYLKHFSISFMKKYDTMSFNECYNGANVSSYTNTELERDPEYQAKFSIYRSLQDEHKNTLATYKGYGHNFFSNLTTSVKTIGINADMFDNVVQLLANSDMEPVKLEISGPMEDIRQLEFIKDIKELRSLELSILIKQQDCSYRFPSANITRLTLLNLSKNIPIHWVLSIFPSLEELCLHGAISLTATENNITESYPNLRKLNTKGYAVNQACLDYLKATAPNIQDIVMEIVYNFKISIDISDWDLKWLKISCRTEQFYCYIITPGRMKLIKYNPKDQSFKVAKKRNRAEDDMDYAWISIVTTKEKHFTFNGFPISLSHDRITIDI